MSIASTGRRNKSEVRHEQLQEIAFERLSVLRENLGFATKNDCVSEEVGGYIPFPNFHTQYCNTTQDIHGADLDTQNWPQHSQVKRDHKTVCERVEHAGGKGESLGTSLELAHYSSQ